MPWVADFETTTNEHDCRVWTYGLCDIYDPDRSFKYGNNIGSFINWCEDQENETVYFHNLKFDGEFILYYLFEHDFTYIDDRRNARSQTFTTLISDAGQFYTITIYFDVSKNKKKKVTIYDSLKILPFKVSEIAKAFGLQEAKGSIDYDMDRPVGYVPTRDEVEYLKNDVVIVAKALRSLFDQKLKKMTQGSNALHDYKEIVTEEKFKKWFPAPKYDHDIRQSYKGGWTYVNPKYKDVDIGEGIVLDVNSLYPSVMYHRPLPYGEGMNFQGQYENDELYNLYVQMFSCQFEIKDGYLPTIQLKNNMGFMPNEYIGSSNGEDVTLCLTSVDFELFQKHYNIYNIEYLGGWKFKSTTGLFKDYIEKWNDVKMEATKTGNKGMRTLAKLMLNSLYGKFSLNPYVQSKHPTYDGTFVNYKLGKMERRDPIYIPVGTFITSWARFITITSAQLVYDRFLYADTDSLHLMGTELPESLKIDDVRLGWWKHESTFKRARFIRQKSYIEEINGDLHITCAGMPDHCYKNVTWENFHAGTSYGGKLQHTRVKGGIVLKEIDFTIKL